MNNAWTSIAFRVTYATAQRQQSRAQPPLRLFTGFARQHHFTHPAGAGASSRHVSVLEHRRKAVRVTVQHGERSLSTTTAPGAKKKLRQSQSPQSETSPKPPRPSSAPKLGPAQTIAAHTEGLTPPNEPTAESEESVQLTWRDYDPSGGMPLPGGELSQAEIDDIFASEAREGEPISAAQGNYILSVMRWRRMSGALIDVGLDFPPSGQVSAPQALLALRHLRRLDPSIDESANAQTWAHEETHRLQESIQQRAVKLGLYRAAPDEDPEDTPEEEPPQGTPEGRARTSTSVLETLRADASSRRASAAAASALAQSRAKSATLHSLRGPLELSAGVQPPSPQLEITPSGGVQIARPRPSAWLQPVERKPWVKYFEEQAQIIRSQEVPSLSTPRRLGPGAALLAAVLLACWALAENYTPPPRAARLWPELAPSAATLTGLSAVLVAGFVAGRLPPLWRTFSKYLTLVPAFPYAVSLVGAGVRHDSLVHLGSNLVTLWLFGLLLHEDVGRGGFLAVYVASGALGGFASLTVNVLRRNWMTYIFGSSGSVLGVVAAACALRPNGTLQLMGHEIPVAAWVFLALFAGGEVVAAVRGFKTMIDHAGHLGGIAGGVAAGVCLRRAGGRGEMGSVRVPVGGDIVREAEAAT